MMLEMQRIEKTIANLKKNNMEAIFVPDKKQLPAVLERLVREGNQVTFGGSMTLKQGVMEYLRRLDQEGKITLLDRDQEGITSDDIAEIYREAFHSDVYFASSNAVTENGCLYNVDGNGNRVAAMIFGPKSVVVIVGYNKLVETEREAIERVQKIAAPQNALRLKVNTPCTQTGKCEQCNSENRICASYTFFGRQRIPNRIKVIILGEEYGY